MGFASVAASVASGFSGTDQGYKLLAAVDRAYYDCDADRFVGLGDYEGTVVNAIENAEIKECDY